MEAIEPHWISLLWFAAFATVCTLALLIVAGMFPLRIAPGRGQIGTATLLMVGNAILLAALLTGTGLLRLRRTSVEHADRRDRPGRAVCARTVRGLAVVAARWQDRACRAGRRSGAGARSAGESRGTALGKPVVNWCGECDAGKNQARSVADASSWWRPLPFYFQHVLGHDRIQYVVAFLGFFMIFAMWLFPEVKRDDTAGGARRDSSPR